MDCTCEPVSSMGLFGTGVFLMRTSQAQMLVQSGSMVNHGTYLVDVASGDDKPLYGGRMADPDSIA